MYRQNRILLRLFFTISIIIIGSHQTRVAYTPNVNRTILGWPVPLCPVTALCGDDGDPISCGQTYKEHFLASCHCDNRCVFYNDCCLDYALSCTSNGTTDYPDPPPIVGINHDQVTCVRIPGSPARYYRVVSKCTDSWTRDDVKFECEREADIQNPHQFIPVDFKGEITFKNVYCAICNGKDKDDLTPWTLEATCHFDGTSSLTSRSTFEEKATFAYVVTDCISWHLKATMWTGDGRSCIITPTSDQCGNVTMASPSPSPGSLFDACSLYQAEIVVNGVKHRNPHCYQCTTGSLHGYSQVDSILRNLTCPYSPPITLPRPGQRTSSISLLLDFSIPVTCRDDQRFDSETLTCVNLTCPDGFLLDGKLSCVSANADDIFEENCSDASSFPTNINMECKETINQDEQCLSPFLLTDELHPALRSIFNFSQELRVDLIQVSAPSIAGNETDCSPRVNISGYLQGYYFSELDALFSSTEPSNISLSSFFCQVSRFQVNYGCMINIDDCPNHIIASNPKYHFNNLTIVSENDDFEFSLDDSTYYFTRSLNTSTNSYTKEDYSLVCNSTRYTPCPLLTLNASLFKEMHDGSLLYLTSNISFTPGEFTKIGNHSVQVCNFLEEYMPFINYSAAQATLSTVGSCLSVVTLLLTIATYGCFKSLRNNTFSIIIISLCISLVFAHIFLLLSGVSVLIPGTCITVAILGHYMWLVVFSHTFALAVDLHRRFGVTVSVGQVDEGAAVLLYFLVFSWTCPLLVVIPCLCLFFTGFNVPSFNLSYGQRNCWIGDGLANLYVFGIPIAFFLLINLIIFTSIIAGIRMKTVPTERGHSKRKLSDLWIYVKMSTILGFTWIFGFIAAFTDVTALWYIFIILNSLQGVYIFIAFVCNKRVFKLWRDSFSCLTSTPRFPVLSKRKKNVNKSSPQSTTIAGSGKNDYCETTSTF
nr:uncharacterized protein LOC129282939 [Lytechinus pictus]